MIMQKECVWDKTFLLHVLGPTYLFTPKRHSSFSVIARSDRSGRSGIFVFQFKFNFLVHILTCQFF